MRNIKVVSLERKKIIRILGRRYKSNIIYRWYITINIGGKLLKLAISDKEADWINQPNPSSVGWITRRKNEKLRRKLGWT